jgi:hypothetical protein
MLTPIIEDDSVHSPKKFNQSDLIEQQYQLQTTPVYNTPQLAA